VLTNLYHDSQLYNTLIPTSHESPAVGLRISRLSGPVEITLRYATPDIHCRHRRHECDGGISRKFSETTKDRYTVRGKYTLQHCTVGRRQLVFFKRVYFYNVAVIVLLAKF